VAAVTCDAIVVAKTVRVSELGSLDDSIRDIVAIRCFCVEQ